MVAIRPVRVRLVRPEWTDRVPSPAHDAVSAIQRLEYLELTPDSFLSVTRSIDDIPDGVEMTHTELLEQGLASLKALLEKGAFTPQRDPSMYVYRLELGGHRQDGIICGVATEAFETGDVRAHEHVFGAQRDHIARHYEIVRAQSSPIVMAHEDNSEVTQILAETSGGEPLLDFSVADGLRQTIWPIDDLASARLGETLAHQPFYIVDGHHRTGAAQTYREEVGPGTADLMLSAVFSATQMRNHPYHRWLRNEDDCRTLLDGCRESFDVRELSLETLHERRSDELAIYHAGTWLAVRVPSLPDGDALSSLGSVRLERHLLAPLVGIDYSAPRQRLAYVSGEGPTSVLTAMIDRDGGALMLMRPVTMEELFAVADAGQIMPAKSTYFTPKARSGVMLRPL